MSSPEISCSPPLFFCFVAIVDIQRQSFHERQRTKVKRPDCILRLGFVSSPVAVLLWDPGANLLMTLPVSSAVSPHANTRCLMWSILG